MIIQEEIFVISNHKRVRALGTSVEIIKLNNKLEALGYQVSFEITNKTNNPYLITNAPLNIVEEVK